MSIEQQIEALTAALNANTQAVLGNVASPTATPATTAAPPPVPAQTVAAVPVPPAAAQPIPPAAAPPAAASPSNVAPAMTLEQLQQEVSAIYQTRNADPQVMAIVQQYAPDLTSVPAEHYDNLIAALRALP